MVAACLCLNTEYVRRENFMLQETLICNCQDLISKKVKSQIHSILQKLDVQDIFSPLKILIIKSTKKKIIENKYTEKSERTSSDDWRHLDKRIEDD